MQYPKRAAILILFSTAIAIVHNAGLAAGQDSRMYGAGSRFADELPFGQFKSALDSLPPQAKTRALHWLHSFSFAEEDLEYLRVDRDGGIFYSDTFVPDQADAPGQDGTVVLEAITAADVFSLHSRPGASRVVYLDFDGGRVSGTAWSNSAGSTTWNAKPYDTDGNLSAFSSTELAQIQEIWHRVAEDYAPFDIDVTTEHPGTFGPQTGWVLVTSSDKNTDNPLPHENAGGVAYVNVWGTSYYENYMPAFVYYDNLGSGHPPYVAEAAAHELGHNLGLSHDGTTSGSAYYAGHGSGYVSWAPIMGVGYSRNVTQWSKGEYTDANQLQDDVAIVGSKITLRADDHANALSPDATPLVVDGAGLVTASNPEMDPRNLLSANKGVVENRDDLDVFVFSAGSGQVDITVNPAWDAFYRSSRRGANLDVHVALFDAWGNLITESDPLDETSARVAASIAPGVYYLAVNGVGNAGNYSDYASLGEYFINGAVPVASADTTAPTPDPMFWEITPQASGPDTVVMTATTASDDNGATVEYQFRCASGGQGCVDSAWQTARSFSASGLAAGTTYAFQVRARDLAHNETQWSAPASATTETPNAAPTAAFEAGCAGLNCSFTDLSNDTDGYIAAWSWDFGDGTRSTEQKPRHAYSAGGIFTVSLRVTDERGATQSAVQTILVEAPPPPVAPYNVEAADTGNGAGLISWIDASSTETGFEIEREFQHKNGSWRGATMIDSGVAGDDVTGESETASDPSGAGTFRYRVRAYNAYGASAWSDWSVAVEVTNNAGGDGSSGGGGGSGVCRGKKC